MENEAPKQPAAAYWARQQSRAAEVARFQRRHFLIGYVRVGLAFAGIAIVWFALTSGTLSAWWALLPVALLIAGGQVHAGVLAKRATARRAVAFYEVGLAHIEEKWAGLRPRKTSLDITDSLYASELNLFDKDGLFELLCAARTRMGEDRLAEWLLTPGTAAEMRERHAAITDLRDRLDFREDMAVTGVDATIGRDPAELLAWAEENAQDLPDWMRWVAPTLVVMTIGAAAYSLYIASLAPLVIMVIVDAILTFRFQGRTSAVLAGAQRTAESLRLFSALIERMEQEPFQAELLLTLQSRYRPDGRRASSAIASLSRVAEMADYRLNYIVRILDAPLLYSLQVAGRAQAWRRTHGQTCRAWLNTLGQMEALLSLANYSYEHPADPFPEIVEGELVFEATALGHPLMPEAECTRNDVTMDTKTWMLIVTGSNMSGKSTLLRAVGMNAVLALAGAPVRARSLRISPLRVGANIGINDSFTDGRSRFYAEILRLGAICELAEREPVLFLLDELLGGTNSADRQTGAELLTGVLLRNGAIGMISTHDLALAEIADREGWHSTQWHFEDQIIDGGMRFDYLLKPGVVTTHNGVELMRLIGIKI